MMEFVDKTHTAEEVMGVMEPLISTWFKERFTTLTEPQARAIPEIHKRKNVLVSSPTGSGKTLTAFTSIINELTRYASEGKLEERIYCIYISPLKALANDVNRNLNTPLNEMRVVAEANGMNIPDIKVAVRSGDTPQSERQKMARHPPHILITTPESLSLILAAPKFKENLKSLEWIILDEIHDICDSKRGAFLSLTLERLREYCERDITRIGLSATLAPIEDIAGFLVGCNPDGTTRDVTIVESSSKKELDLKVICPTEDMTALSSEIVNSMMYDTLKGLVDDHETTLIFTNTRSGAESVVYKLKERGLESVEVHHSSLGREIRLDVEERLKRGEIRCVVSSTSLELGIDIGSVDLVCQIGSPKSVAKGLQRIGRSGHSFGKVAKGRLIVFDLDDLAECAVMCRAAHRGKIDRVGIPENCLDVLMQTLIGMSLDNRWQALDAYGVVKGSYCYRNLTEERFIDVLRYLGSKGEHEGVYSKIWYDVEEAVFGKKKGTRMTYLTNLGTIPEEANYKVITNHGITAGELSERFVERLSPTDVFVLGGRSLEFIRSRGMIAHVKEASGRKPTVPSWSGEMLPRSFDLSMDVARFRGEMSEMLDQGQEDLIPFICKEFDVDEGSAISLISYFKEQKAVTGLIPDDGRLIIEEYVDPSGNQRLIFHFPFGRRVNDALSRAYAYRISGAAGSNVSLTVSDDSFMIGTPRRVDPATVASMLKARDMEAILRRAIRDSEIFKLRFRHTASRSFMVLRNYMGKPISVNKQQLRSAYLLDSLRGMENVPVIEETYREILEDDMDINNAKYVVELIENGTIGVMPIAFSGTPSPFAHSIILSGLSDIVLMEDRSALLKELHRKVLHRAIGDNVGMFEFTEDEIVPFFASKVPRICEREDIPALLMCTGPLQAFKERGRHIYTYSDVDRKELDSWVRDMIHNGTLSVVFLDDPHVMVSSEASKYASALARPREMNEADEVVYGVLNERMTIPDMASKAELSESLVYRSIRKMESMYKVGRVALTSDYKWLFERVEHQAMDREKAIDDIVYRHLGCFAPATVPEVAFALSLSDSEAHQSLEAMVYNEDVAKGNFLISESVQYMRSIDRMSLRAGKTNVYDFQTIENYRRSKWKGFPSIREYFEFFGSAGSDLDVFNRVEGFDINEWASMRESGELLCGRFIRGKIRYVLKDFGAKLASLCEPELTEFDESVLRMIEGMNEATMRQLTSLMNVEKEMVKESILRLDKSLRIIRVSSSGEEWGSENIYAPYVPEDVGEDAYIDVVRGNLRAYGPVPMNALSYISNVSSVKLERAFKEIGAETIYVGSAQNPMYIMPDELPLPRLSCMECESIAIKSLTDPDMGSKWSEIASRYGDKWVFPISRGSIVLGALEMWEMSGCIEVRSLDLDNPDMLDRTLDAIDRMMEFYLQKGVDIVRIREVLGNDAADLDEHVASLLKSKGYRFVNGFYAKGRFTPRTMTDEERLSYVFSRQRIGRSSRFSSLDEMVNARGYIRNDQELATRYPMRLRSKRPLERDDLVKMTLIPNFVGYTTLKFASLYRAAKEVEVDEDVQMVYGMIGARQPISKKEVVAMSPLTEGRTSEAIAFLYKHAMVYQDHDSFLGIVPTCNIGRHDALKEIARMRFNEFGIFSAEELSVFMDARMGETRGVLKGLEDEGFLVKGFLVEGDSTPRWMLAEDIDVKPRRFNETFMLNSQDNLHFYLRGMIKGLCGATECVVFEGTSIVGHFKGKVTASGARVENFEGSDRAMRYIMDLSRTIGVRLELTTQEEEGNWDVSDFYRKTNPGA